VKIIKPETIKASVTYSFIQPWGPKAIDGFASVIPFLRICSHNWKVFLAEYLEKYQFDIKNSGNCVSG
jgi:hypothetical protein